MEKVDEERTNGLQEETPAEKLNRNLPKALDRHDEILSHHIDPYGDPQLRARVKENPMKGKVCQSLAL
jgi:hypothetical protein